MPSAGHRLFCRPQPTQSDSKDGQKNSLDICGSSLIFANEIAISLIKRDCMIPSECERCTSGSIGFDQVRQKGARPIAALPDGQSVSDAVKLLAYVRSEG